MAKRKDYTFQASESFRERAELRDAAGLPLDLDGAFIEWGLTSLDGSVSFLASTDNGLIAITDLTDAQVLVNVPPTAHPDVVAGEYWRQLRATLGDGTVSTQVVGTITVAGPPFPDGGDGGSVDEVALQLVFDSQTADANPGNGRVRFNDDPLSDATFAYFNLVDRFSVDISAWLAALDDSSTDTPKGTIRFVKLGRESVWYEYQITDTVTVGLTYDKVPLAYISGAGSFVNGDILMVAFSRTGDKGDQGDPGADSAPIDATYLVKTANVTLTQERALTDGTSITADWSVSGQVKLLRAALAGDVAAAQDDNQLTIQADAVSNSKLANMAEATFKMRAASAGTGDPIDGTAAQAKTALDIRASNISDFSEGVDDRVAALLVAGTNITLTYDDPGGSLTIDAAGGGAIDVQSATVSVVDPATAIDFSAQFSVTDEGGGVAGIAFVGSASDVTNDSGVAGSTVKDALDQLETEIGGAGAVASVFGRTGTVIANTGDYAASEVTNDSGVVGTSVADALDTLDAALPTGTNTGDQLIFQTIAVSGQSNVAADTTTDTLTLVAGANVTITTNAGTDSITIASSISGATVSDGDYGDITVSSSGTVYTIDNDVVTLAKMANMATASFLGRNTAGTGDPEVLSEATAKTMLNLTGTNSGDQTITLTGDVTGSGAGSFAATIANDAVIYAKMQNVSATDKLLGRFTAGSGDVEEITCTATGRSLIDDSSTSVMRTTLGLVIGTDVLAYSSHVLFDNTSVNLTVGYTTTTYSNGTVSSGTLTPNPANGAMQKYTNNGAHTLAPPSTGTGDATTITLEITNGASAGATTTSGFTKVRGDGLDTTNAHKFVCFIYVGPAGSILDVAAMQ